MCEHEIVCKTVDTRLSIGTAILLERGGGYYVHVYYACIISM